MIKESFTSTNTVIGAGAIIGQVAIPIPVLGAAGLLSIFELWSLGH